MSSFSQHHRRSTTATASLPSMASSTRTSSIAAPRRGSEQQLPTWRHRRTNSHFEATSMLRTARSNTLPVLPAECMQAAVAAAEKAAAELATKTAASNATTKPAARKNSSASRADKVDNWRVKTAKASEAVVSKQCCSCSQTTESKHKTQDKTASLPVVPQVLPPIHVSMEPAPVEVLPPLRFSMDPIVNGRSAWRFVLPEGESKTVAKDAADGEISTEELIDDLPRWFTGKESDMIVRMGNAIERSVSPSARSSASAYSSDDGARHDAPPLDYYGDDDDASSAASSSQTASPVLGGMRQLALYPDSIDEDTSDVKTPMAGMQHFAVPSLSAAAPLPSLLPMPSFLARNMAK